MTIFVSLLPEIGPPPSSLEWNGLECQILDAGGSRILALRAPDGGIYIVRDLSDVEARDDIQVGRDWDDAKRYAMRLEEERDRSYRRFMQRQREIRAAEWKREVLVSVLTPLLRWADRDVNKATDCITGNSTLSYLARHYLEVQGDLTRDEVRHLLSGLGKGRRRRGRKPRLTGIITRSEELLTREIMVSCLMTLVLR